jgi:hypothetical protein
MTNFEYPIKNKNMNKTILFLLMLCLPMSCLWAQNQKGSLSKNGKSNYEWLNKTVDLGKIAHNVPKVAEFKFKNTGDVPIAVIKAEGSCGCTQIDYPKAPVNPGQTITIKATYDATSKGAFTKTVKVTLSNNDYETLILKGVVE